MCQSLQRLRFHHEGLGLGLERFAAAQSAVKSLRPLEAYLRPHCLPRRRPPLSLQPSPKRCIWGCGMNRGAQRRRLARLTGRSVDQGARPRPALVPAPAPRSCPRELLSLSSSAKRTYHPTTPPTQQHPSMEELDALLRAGGDGAAILRHIRLNKVRPLCGCVWGGMAVTGRRDCCRLASALCSYVCVCMCLPVARSLNNQNTHCHTLHTHTHRSAPLPRCCNTDGTTFCRGRGPASGMRVRYGHACVNRIGLEHRRQPG